MKAKKKTAKQIEDERINNLSIIDFLIECDLIKKTDISEEDYFSIIEEENEIKNKMKCKRKSPDFSGLFVEE